MELQEALAFVSDGHGVFAEAVVQEVCTVFGVPFPDRLVWRWQGKADAFRQYGFVPFEDVPGSGVGGLELSYYVAQCLGVGTPGSAFSGKGFQAQANGQAIAEKLLDGV